MPSNLVKVAVLLPLYETYTYRVPVQMSSVQRGCRVEVQLGRRKTVGVVVETDASAGDLAPLTIKPLLDMLDPEPMIEQDLLDLVLVSPPPPPLFLTLRQCPCQVSPSSST